MIRALAWRSVTARKLRAILNGAGIVLGVALIFSVLSLSKTIVGTFDDLFSAVYGETDLIVSGADAAGTVDQSLLSKIQATDGVDVATGSVMSVLTLVKSTDPKTAAKFDQKQQINVGGVLPSDPDLSGAEISAGRRLRGGYEIQIDQSFAKHNSLKIGQKVKLASQTGIDSFTIVGFFRIGGGIDFGGQGFASIPLDTARKVFDVPTGYGEIDIAVKPEADLASVRKAIEGQLEKGVEVRTPSDVSDDINSQIQGFNIILYFFSAMSLFVGGFLILNSFNMTVAQRMREIGMLRTLGGSRGMIARMFLFEAVLLGLLGSVFGVALGLVLTKLMVALVGNIGLPMGNIKYPVYAFVTAPTLGVIATLFGALRPAMRAGRIPPIEAVLSEHRAKPLKLRRRVLVGTTLVGLGLLGVFTLASANKTPLPIVLAGAFGVIFLFSGVIMLGPVVVPVIVRVLSWPLRRLSPIEGRLAADGSRANPLRTASTASGLMIGIALVAAIGSLGSSFIGSISDDLDAELKHDFTVQPQNLTGGGPQATISTNAAEAISALDGAGPVTGVRLLFLSSGYGAGMQAYGLDPSLHLRFANPEYAAGARPDVDARLAAGEVTVPEALAKRKGTKVGDKISLEGPRGARNFTVAALQKGNSFEASSIVMSHESFLAVYGIPGYTQVLVIADSAELHGALGKRIDQLLARDYPAFESLSNEDVKTQIKNQINQVFSIFYVIMAVAILVSLLGVVNTLLMNVLERTREIGVLRAIGAVRWQVRRIIIQESLLLTSAGAALGLVVGMALGYAFVRGINTGSGGVGFHPPIAVIFTVAAMSVIFGLVAALLPARRAARMNVIEAVSYE
ncbi:MAG: ABC transporter permease [Actinobacteria bacterium]|nr:ABC transporter permease [Actinomycetota bacterium]